MDPLTALDRAAQTFGLTLAQVQEGQWQDPTPNDGQNVRQLVDHVIGGNRMATVILDGGSREEGLAQFARAKDDVDPVAAFEQSRVEMAEAFAQPGALQRMVAHPAQEMPGQMLLVFRITEYALHGWDLARAIGADESIDPEVAAVLWDILSPMEGLMAGSGMFGAGRSGTVPDDAPLELRVLDISGRRP